MNILFLEKDKGYGSGSLGVESHCINSEKNDYLIANLLEPISSCGSSKFGEKKGLIILLEMVYVYN